MGKLSKKELQSLKQEGGSTVVALLVLAGIGLIAGTALLMSSGPYMGGPGTVITTTTPGYGYGPGAMGGPGVPGTVGVPGTTTTVINNPGMGYGYGGPMDAVLPFAAGVVVGDAISGEGLQKGGSAVDLPQDGLKGGWIKHKSLYYHYEFTKDQKNQDMVLIRKFVKA